MRPDRKSYVRGLLCGLVVCTVGASAMGGEKDEQLLKAAETGDMGSVKRLLDQGADVRIQNARGWSALAFAAQQGNVEFVRLLLANKADPKAQTDEEFTPLMLACDAGHVEVVKLLLANRSGYLDTDWNYIGEKGNALKLAAGKGHLDVVKAILAEGNDAARGGMGTLLRLASKGNYVELYKYLAKLDTDSSPRETPLYLSRYSIASNALLRAAGRGDLSTVRQLMKRNEFSSPETLKLALRLAEQEGHVELMAYLQAEAAPRLAVGEEKARLQKQLLEAIRAGNYENVKILLYRGAGVMGTDESTSPLGVAAGCGQLEILKVLLDSGGDLTKDVSPFHAAMFAKDQRILKFLMARGGNSIPKNLYSEMLIETVEFADLDFLRTVIRQGANPEVATQWNKETPLMRAAKQGRADVVKLLIDSGARVDAQNYRGYTALAFAQSEFHDAAVKVLRMAGAKPPAGPGEARNALFDHLDDPKRLKELLGRGADVNGRGEFGRSALYESLNFGKLAAAAVLIEGGANVRDPEQTLYLSFPMNDETGDIRILGMMLDRGADINVRAGNGDTPLISALKSKRTAVAHFLITRGADVKLKDRAGKTALTLARELELGTLVKDLLNAGAK